MAETRFRTRWWVWGLLLALLVVPLGGCGWLDDDDDDDDGGPAPGVRVTLNLNASTVAPGGGATFAATVTGASDTTVTWELDAGTCGADAGTLTGGAYTAGSPVEDCEVTVRAIASADPSAAAEAVVTVDAPVVVSVNLGAVTVAPDGTQAFAATVTGAGSGSRAVTWSVDLGTCGSDAGSVSAAGIYTAGDPLDDCQVTVRATSVEDASKSAAATVTVDAPVSVSLSPASASVAAGGSQTFVATVRGATNTAVTWAVDGGGTCGADAGSVAGGAYQAGLPGAPCQDVVRATSVEDGGKSATATVEVSAAAPSAAVVLDTGAPGEFLLGDQADVALDPSGNGFAVWPRLGAAGFDIWAARYDAGTGAWEAPLLLEDSDHSASTPAVAVSPSGDAFVVWAQLYQPVVPGEVYGPVAWASRFDAATEQWGPAAPIATLDAAVNMLDVATDAAGNAFVAWAADPPNAGRRMFASRYDAGTQTWQGAQLLDVGVTGGGTWEGSGPSFSRWSGLAVDQGGNAAVIWSYLNSSTQEQLLVLNRYDAASGFWQGAHAFDSPSPAFEDLVALAGEDLLAVWFRGNSASPLGEIMTSRYDAGAGTWGPPQAIHAGDEIEPSSLRPASDGAGNAVVVWIRSTQNGFVEDLWGMAYDGLAGAWGAPALLESGAERAQQHAVAMDASGQALAVWTQAPDASSERVPMGARYDAATDAWGAAFPLASGLTSLSTWPQVAMDGNGGAAVIWQQGTWDLMGVVSP